MTAEKFSASMERSVLADARAAAEADGVTLSCWLADATADRLRLRGLHELIEDWEAEHGEITTGELYELDTVVREARCGAAAGRVAQNRSV